MLETFKLGGEIEKPLLPNNKNFSIISYKASTISLCIAWKNVMDMAIGEITT